MIPNRGGVEAQVKPAAEMISGTTSSLPATLSLARQAGQWQAGLKPQARRVGVNLLTPVKKYPILAGEKVQQGGRP